MGSKVEVSIEGSADFSNLCDSQLIEIEKLRESILHLLMTRPTGSLSSSDLRKLILEILEKLKWSKRVIVTPYFARGNPTATLKVSGLSDVRNCTCNKVHRILVNCMFDNRQAIGTNLLKFEVADSYFRSKNKDVVSIGLCISENAKFRNNWDSSIAIFDEYSGALLNQYKQVIQSSILLWEINF